MVDHVRSACLTMPMVVDVFTATADNLDTVVQELNRLNVFPVADGDTGTNMAATMRPIATAAREAASSGQADDDEFSRTVTRAGLRSARGNSGLIFSQFLTGFASSLTDPSSARGALEIALRGAAGRARGAVSHPVEGTMLTVADAVAAAVDGLVEMEPEASAQSIAALARSTAHRATEETTSQLAVLAEHDVVDAGAVGLTHFFDALAAVIALESMVHDAERSASRDALADEAATRGLVGYEYTFVLDTESSRSGDMADEMAHNGPRDLEAVAALLRAWLSERGDDVVVGSGAGLIKAHVHVGLDTDANDALLRELVATFGRIEDLRSEALVDQSPDRPTARDSRSG